MSFQRFTLFFIVGIVLFTLSYYFGHQLQKLLFPIYEWMIYQLEYRLDTVYLVAKQLESGSYLIFKGTISHAFYLHNELVEPSRAIVIMVGQSITNIMHPFVLIFTTVWGWPTPSQSHRWQIYFYRTLFAVPVALMLILLSTPILLVSAFWEKFSQGQQVNLNHTWYDYFSDICNSGGLVALSIGLGVLTVGIVNQLIQPQPSTC